MTARTRHRTARGTFPLLLLLASLPALAVGVLVMRAAGVPASLWGQNVAAWAVGALLCFGVWRARASAQRWIRPEIVAALVLAALVATLFDGGLEGVHRWVSLGSARLHPAALLLPLLLVALDGLARTRGRWTALLVATGVALVLFLQPDAAQATAFGVAASALLLPGVGRDKWRAVGIAILPLVAGLSWLRPDPLAPVPYVEDVVPLAAGLGIGWGVAAVASLLLLPLPFFLAGRGAERRVGPALGAYVTIVVLAPLAGNFPVPILGYGISPIVGYFLGVGALLHATSRESRDRAPAPEAPPGDTDFR